MTETSIPMKSSGTIYRKQVALPSEKSVHGHLLPDKHGFNLLLNPVSLIDLAQTLALDRQQSAAPALASAKA
jgi:hypothetical protein